MSTRVDSIVSAMVGPDPASSTPILDALADCIAADAVTVDGVELTRPGKVWSRENNKLVIESYNGLPGARISKVSKENPDALILVEWSQEAGCWEVGWQLYRAGHVIAQAEWEDRLVPAIPVPDLEFVKAAFDGAAG